ncbi:hypothetical protein ACIRL2_09635 [Embleya sp. NPDC127516]|uniref:hypothetical protein n=1 Tax=Embleya sp. NPDC127516 TaxID=3363990 RepID=UPI003814345F
MTPYLLIKVSWVVGSLVGMLPIGSGFGLTEWVVLNTATVGMAGIGIAVALALVRPWGMRIPGAPLAFCAWVGTGFLVPMLPYAVLGSVWTSGGDSDSGTEAGGDAGAGPEAAGDAGTGAEDASMPGWEAVLVQIGFVGMGLGLALALPAYLLRRRPDVFAGRVGDRATATGPARRRVPWSAVGGAVLGAVWLYWAMGGKLGVAHPEARDAQWRILTGIWGGWALVAAIAGRLLVWGRPARLPRWLPVALGWIGSGSLFAWSGWKLPFTLYLALAHPAGTTLPENLAYAVVLHALAVAVGVAMVRGLVRTAGTGAALRNGDRSGDRSEDRSGDRSADRSGGGVGAGTGKAPEAVAYPGRGRRGRRRDVAATWSRSAVGRVPRTAVMAPPDVRSG